MGNIEPGRTFVRFRRKGVDDDSFLAFVAGVLGKGGDELLLCLINERDFIEAHRRQCTEVSPNTMTGSILGFIAQEPEFGVGVVVSEERINDELFLELLHDDKFSGLVPLTDITLCYPGPRPG